MKNPFTSLKEKAVAGGIKAFINREINDFGEVSELEIDTSEKTLRAKLELKGEETPVVVNVGSYQVTEKNGKIFLTVGKVDASREWLTAALGKYAAGRAFQLPDAARVLL